MVTTALHPNVEKARRAYAAFSAADMATVNELMADDIEWHIGGNSSFAGVYKGKDAVFGFFGKLMETTGGTFKLEVHDILANDEHTIALVTETSQMNGKTLVGRAVHIIHPDSEGRTKEFWTFLEDQAAADAFFA